MIYQPGNAEFTIIVLYLFPLNNCQKHEKEDNLFDPLLLHFAPFWMISWIWDEIEQRSLRWPFFINPMGSFRRGIQISRNWCGWQLDTSLDSENF